MSFASRFASFLLSNHCHGKQTESHVQRAIGSSGLQGLTALVNWHWQVREFVQSGRLIDKPEVGISIHR